MKLSNVTLIVLSANVMTAVIAAALLMLVLWQAPRRRANQLFAAVMLLLMAYSLVNGLARFVDELNADPAEIFYLAMTLYILFVVMTFFFASEFSGIHTLTIRIVRGGGLVLVVILLVSMWDGRLVNDFEPVATQDGSYQGHWTPYGLVSASLMIGYLLTTAVVLRRMQGERSRWLWLAPVFVMLSVVSATVIWPLVPVPFSALFLAASAVVMGRQVLRFELFNPLATLNQKLAMHNDELEAASRMKNQFLTNMSHELRTPLNSIIGYTQLVVNGTYGALNDTQRDRLEKVIRNGHHLLDLVNGVLDLNRIESGRVTLEWAALDTAALLEGVLNTIEPLATEKGLSIVREFADTPHLWADEVRTQQIVTNILANAIKFTSEGSITIRALGVQGNRMVQLEFVDTGIGIHPDNYDAVFAEFQQLDSSSTRQYQGTGLGMAITKKLVEMHGGRIWLISQPGQGTTFFVTLPAVDHKTAGRHIQAMAART
ncbi:MAG: HAMP domain-containing histidine kinase [Anaerolineae bacterium]|nr:HAMP domain-containing histidine kinase [Anaerolineae bacterium]